MVNILQIETSTKNCSVALSQNGKTLICKELSKAGFSHAEKLHVFVEEVCKETAIEINQIHAVAVSSGPGSYTGLRIGVSAAKGLCYALQIPLISIDTLTVLAKNIVISNGVIVPMIDARRMECYTAIFDLNYQKIRETKAEIITDEYLENISETIYLVGDGAPKCESVLNPNKFIFNNQNLYPSAKSMSELAFNSFQNKNFVDLAYFEPNYLKEFQISK